MAILQALFALVSRSAGKILNAIFGWAVRALFGRTSAKERTFLSGLVAAAAAWPLLLLGLAAPKVAALLLAFVPVPKSVPSWVVRLVWLGLVVLVPLAIGIAMAAKAPAHAPKRSFVRRLLSGFPMTVGLALAFLIMFVTVPIMRLWSLLRGQASADVPLITDANAYHNTANLTVAVLNRHGLGLHQAEPGWWVAAPTRVLRFFGGESFGSFVPDQLEHYEGKDLAVSFYPSGIMLRGKGQRLTWAHGLIAEAASRGDGFQTTVPAAQELEKRIKRLWHIYDNEPKAHRDAPLLTRRVDEVARELGSIDAGFDDWQVLYRQVLQLERAVHGNAQLLEKQADDKPAAHTQEIKSASSVGDAPHLTARSKTRDSDSLEAAVENESGNPNAIGRHASNPPTGVPTTRHQVEPPQTVGRQARDLSTVELIKEITSEVGRLASKQIELAKTELKADLKAEATTVGGLGIAALAGLATVNLLLVTLVLALAQSMPAWAAGLLVSGFTLVVAVVVALVAWNKRVRSPMARTRRTVKEDVQFTKERLV